MPRGDGTGPAGMGPITGRGAGLCAGYSVPGYMNAAGGRGGFGFGRGGGFGRRNRFCATGVPGWAGGGGAWGAWAGADSGVAPPYPVRSPEQERRALQTQAEYLENALRDVKKRIDDMGPDGAGGE